MKLNDDQIASLANFVLDVLDDFPDIGNLDGGDLQEIAERHKILIPQIVHVPCRDDGCACSEMCTDEEFTAGVTCYRIADWLDRDAQLRNEADAGEHTCPVCEGRGMRAFSDCPGLWYCYACKGTGQV